MGDAQREEISIAFVTVPSVEEGEGLAKKALNARLAACVNIVPGLKSIYWWEGSIEESKEALMVIKTKKEHISKLEALIVSEHPYDTPEFVALPVESISEGYLAWLLAETSL
ncbi:MAG: divalent-cation tolerance protein CutA [Candidatus Dadabacteria bacterium]|nr:MAG: divalent-cation tolerance protein CutA [Candidatus Dadabacteria bacterium]